MPQSMHAQMWRRRKPTDGPEDEFLKSLLNCGLPTDKRLSRVVFREPAMPTGFPDLVIAYPGRGGLEFSPERGLLTHDHVRLLHHLYMTKGETVRGISGSLLLSESVVETLAADLVVAGVVHRRGQHVVTRAFRQLFALRRIVAIEGKIGNWKHALSQAVANTWFASHSYIVIPPTRSLSVVVAEAMRLGVGVWVFDGTSLEIAAESETHQIPTSYGSWLINEWSILRDGKRAAC